MRDVVKYIIANGILSQRPRGTQGKCRFIAELVAGPYGRPDFPTHSEEPGNVILSAAASPIQTCTNAGRRPKDLESALGPGGRSALYDSGSP